MERFRPISDGQSSDATSGAFSGARDGASPEIRTVVTTAGDRTPDANTYLAAPTAPPKESAPAATPKKFDRTTFFTLLSRGPLERLSPIHQRSHHLTDGQVKGLIGPHEEGDYSLKGVPDKSPYIEPDIHPVRPFRTHGLVPKYETDGAIEKQDFLIAHGFPTERFLEIYDVEDVTTKGVLPSPTDPAEYPQIPIEEWKENVLEQLEFRKTHTKGEYVAAYANDPLVIFDEISEEDADKIIAYIKETDYVAVLRVQPVEATFVDIQETADIDREFMASYMAGGGVRIYVDRGVVQFPDIASFRDGIPTLVETFAGGKDHEKISKEDAMRAYESIVPRLNEMEANPDQQHYGINTTQSTYFTEQMLGHAFDYINNAEQFQGSPLLPDGGFVAGDAEHTRHFLEKFAPVNMGEYLAGLHKLGISHGYAHGQNWKLGVFLVDLDSAKGVPFGDPEPTEDEKIKDVQRSIHAIDGLFALKGMATSGPNTTTSYVATKFLKNIDDEGEQNNIYAMRKEAVCQFLAQYYKGQNEAITGGEVYNMVYELDLNRGKPDQDGNYEEVYKPDPPIAHNDYIARIFEILNIEEPPRKGFTLPTPEVD